MVGVGWVGVGVGGRGEGGISEAIENLILPLCRPNDTLSSSLHNSGVVNDVGGVGGEWID